MAEEIVKGNTIAEIRASGLTIHAFCEDCQYNAEMDLAKASGAMTVGHLRAHLICSRCGSKNTDMKIFQKVEPSGFN